MELENVSDQRERALEGGDTSAVNVKDPPAFPNQCPNCGQAANVPLATEKVFVRNFRAHSDDRVLVRFHIPYCHACAIAHEHESPGRNQRLLRRLLRRGGGAFYLLIAGLGITCLSWFDPFGNVAPFPLWQRVLVPLGVLSAAAVLFAIALWETRHMASVPPTSITSAVEFTDRLSWDFEPSWRQFRFRRPEYASTFRELNRDRLWVPTSAEAQRSERMGRAYRRVERIIVRAAIAAFLIWLIGSLVQRYFTKQQP